MALRQDRYVSITSGVAGAAAVRDRELIGRLFNDNPLIPTNAILEFTDPDTVGQYFGTNSPEYLRAIFYFGFISKTLSAPQKLSFARYAKALAPPRIYGGKITSSLADFNAINAGTLNLTVGGENAVLVAIDLHAAASFAAVAAAIQAAIRGAAGGQFAAATVTYDGVGQKFTYSSTVNGAADVAAPTGTVAPLLGWTQADTVLSPGADVTDIATALANSAAISTNFGSFAFIPALSQNEAVAAGQWADASDVLYMFCLGFPDLATGQALFAAMLGLSGVAMTYAPTVGEFDELEPMMIEAATDYTRRNSTQNYMYQQFPLTPKVTTDTLADALDAIRANYYGVTQANGQSLSFYQTGVMLGDPTAPVDQNTFANESWLKSHAAAELLSAFLALPKIPANATGRAKLLAILQGPINDALFNGTISVGKPLTTIQKLACTDITGSDKAWMQVQTIGYWVDVVIAPVVVNGVTKYQAEYTLVYSKDDVIRKIVGVHALI